MFHLITAELRGREASYVLGTKAEGGVKQNVALVAMVTCCCDTFRGGRDRQVLVRESLSEQKSHVGPVMLSVMVHYYPIHNPVHTLWQSHGIRVVHLPWEI